MGTTLRSLLDVTIVYPAGVPTFWDLLSRGIPRIVARVREIPLGSEWFTGDYQEDAAFRGRVHAFVRRLWEEKDEEIENVLGEHA
jgi:hypothetical protein